jgi:hypothetical protein
MEKQVKDMVMACEEDRARLCAKAPLKEGMVLKCLRDKKDQVSAKCKKVI